MSTFEKEYYEAERFWEGEGLNDAAHIERFTKTTALIPEDAGSLADIGCGNGIFINFLSEKKDIKLIGIDRSEAALKFVKTDKILGSIDSIPVPENTYDCVTCLEVLEHLSINVFEKALDELSRISKKYIIISTPYKEILEENYTQCPQCKTQFNADLHLRSFSQPEIENLLQRKGFSCISVQTLGESYEYKWHYDFRKIFYPSQFRLWRSPICPICGYKELNHNKRQLINSIPLTKTRSIVSYFSSIPKLFWPKQKKHYWILALYKKQ